MNEEFIKYLYNKGGYSAKGSFDDFKAAIGSPGFRKYLYEKGGYSKKGSFEDFEAGIGLTQPQQAPSPKKNYTPVSITPNPGQDSPELSEFYGQAPTQQQRPSIMTPGSAARQDMRYYAKAEAEAIEKYEAPTKNKQREEQDVAFLSTDSDPFKAAMSTQVDVDNRVKKLGGDPDVARAEIEIGAMNTYLASADNILTRNKERLAKLYQGQGYKARDIDNAIEDYAIAQIRGDEEAIAQLEREHPKLLQDQNAVNAVQAQVKIWEAASIRDNDIPKKYKAYQKREAEKDTMQVVADTKLPVFIPGIGMVSRNVVAGFNQFVGRLAIDYGGPSGRAWGRDMVDFNPKSSDWQGRAFTNAKELEWNGKSYIIEYADKEGKTVERIRDAKTGLDARNLSDKQRTAILKAAEPVEMENRFRSKAMATQMETTIYDLAPVIAVSAVTGGIGGAVARGASTVASAARITSVARNLGTIVGGAAQVRGDLYDEMLRHGGLTASEAAWHSAGAATIIGSLALVNPLESKVLTGMIPGIVNRQVGRMASGQITKSQLRWAIAKDVAMALGKEPIEESLQELAEKGYKSGLDAAHPGPNEFEGKGLGSWNDWKELWAVSAAVGGLMGATSIRTNRRDYVSAALDQALQRPEIMDAYLAGYENRAKAIEDQTRQERELEHVERLKQRWELIKNNAPAIQDLKPEVRGRIATLILESAELEEALQSVTNPALRKTKEAEIEKINAEIEKLVSAGPVSDEIQQPPGHDQPVDRQVYGEDTDFDEEADGDEAWKTAIESVADNSASAGFEIGHTVEGAANGTIIDIDRNSSGTVHAVYVDEGGADPRRIQVFGKTPKEIGLTITGKDETKPKTKAAEVGAGTPASTADTNRMGEKGAATTGPDTQGTGADGGNKTDAAGADTEIDAATDQAQALDPEIAAEYEAEIGRIDAETEQALADIDELQALDPGTDYAADRAAVNTRAETAKSQALVSARRNAINKNRDADTKKARALAKKTGRDAAPILERINARYDQQIQEVDEAERANPSLHTTGSGNIIRYSDIRAIERADEAGFGADAINSRFRLGTEVSDKVLNRYRDAQSRMSGPDKAKIDLKLRQDENGRHNQEVRRQKSRRTGKKNDQRKRGVPGRAVSEGFRTSPHGAPRIRYARSIEINPRNPRAIALQFLLDNTVSRQLLQSLYGGRRRSGEKDISGEVKARTSYVSSKGFDKTDEMADAAWEHYGAHEDVDVYDIRNEIEDIIQTYNTRTEIADELIADHDIARLEEGAMSVEEQAYYAEIDGEREQAMLEWELYMETLTDAELEQAFADEAAFKASPEYDAWLKGETPVSSTEQVNAGTENAVQSVETNPALKDVEKSSLKMLEDEYISKSVEELVALKKKLYPNPDIESPMSLEEKLLNKVIAKKFSEKNQEIIEKRKKANQTQQPAQQDAPVQSVETNPALKKASISPKNLKDLYKINRELFGLDRIKSLASAVAMDKMVGVMAKRANITKTEMYGRLKFEKANEQDLPQGVKLQVDAWHGSPYQFDKFTAKKIGTGEGAQAFGWGLYFTDLKSIAETYASQLSQLNAKILHKGKEVTLIPDHPLYVVAGELIAQRGDIDAAIEYAKERIKEWSSANPPSTAWIKKYEKAIDFLNKNRENITIEGIGRNLYKVSLHKGKTPDQYTWLEWDKPLTEQQIDLIVEHGNNEFGDVFSKEKDGDVFYLGIKRPNGRISQSNLGESVYKNIIQYQTNSQKEASLFLLRAGIDGIKYPAESIARGATSGTARGFNYVVFDENAVSIEEVIKFQKDANKARGAAMVSMDGQSVIYALTDPNVSTPLHEMAHVFEHYMTDAEKAIVHTWAGTKGWTTQTSEKFARGFEKYLAEGKAPTPALQKIFDKFKQWLTDIYNGIVGSDIDIELNDKMRDIYSQMLGAKAVEDLLTQQPPQQPKAETRRIRDQATKKQIADALTEFKKAIKDGRNNLTAGGVNPDAIAKGAKLIGLYVKSGIYKFADIVTDLYAEIGSEVEELFDGLKAAYSAYFATTATDEEAGEMDANIRGVSYAEIISTPDADAYAETDRSGAESKGQSDWNKARFLSILEARAKANATWTANPKPAIGDDALEWAKANADAIVSAYLTESAQTLDPDHLREALTPIGYTGKNVPDYKSAETWLRRRVYDAMLDRAESEGNKTIAFLTAPPGSGKSVAAKGLDLSEKGIIFDSAFNSFEILDEWLSVAKTRGFAVEVIAIYNDPATAFQNTINRGKKSGRFVDLEYFLDAFYLNAGKLEQLRQAYPDIQITGVSNAGNKFTPDADWTTWNYRIGEAEAEQIIKILENEENQLGPDQIASIGRGLREAISDESVPWAGVFRPASDRIATWLAPVRSDTSGGVAENHKPRVADTKTKSDESRKPRPARQNRKGLDPVPESARQGLLFGTETERDTESDSDTERKPVLGSDSRTGGDGSVPTVRTNGDSESGTVPEAVPELSPTNFAFKTPLDPAHAATTFNQRQRFEDNIAALRLLVKLLREKRNATPTEQEVLARYVGWGGIKTVLLPYNQDWSAADEKLRPHVVELMSVIDDLKDLGITNVMDRIKGSVLNAHYTSIPVIRSIYGILHRLGFNGGNVLEPSAGIGNFLGAMPGMMAQNSRINAVELDPLTGEILKKLYPKAVTTIAGYEHANLPKNSFDLVVSNVPFGNYSVFAAKDESPILRKAATRIHNYFLVKALEQTKEGGIVAVITSAGTLDSDSNKFVREHVNETADFLGAIRLPSTAFKGNAGTEVVTDIIFLRKNSSPNKTNPAFLNTVPVDVKHKNSGKPVQIRVNEYFANNPDRVLGTFRAGGQYSETDMTVEPIPNTTVAEQIETLTDSFPRNVFAPKPTISSEQDQDTSDVPDNHYFINHEGVEKIKKDGVETYAAKVHRPKIRPLIQLRDVLAQQYELEMFSDSEAAIAENRQKLNKAYTGFVTRFGALNSPANKKFILDDSFGYNILGLENWDKETGTATKADILSKQVLNRIKRTETASSIEDAIAISVNETGTVNLSRIAELLGQSPEQVLEEGYGLFFRDHLGNIVSRSEYLSGNVKAKLAAAQKLAKTDPLFETNIEELEAVIPEDIPYPAIEVNIGARWIPNQTYEDFLRFLLNTRDVSVSFSRATDTYKVSGLKTPEATNLYGTSRMSAYEIMDAAMHGRTPVIRDKDPISEKSYVNEIETQAVSDKLTAITQAFEDWIWTDEARATELARIYNDRFNTTVRRSYDGTKISIDGMKGVSLRPHQEAAISMIALNNGGIVDHIVGAGKAQPLTAKILTPKGWTTMGDIKVGDLVISRDGKSTPVTGVFPQGKKEIYRVVFSDGSSTECCKEHLWETMTYSERNYAVQNTDNRNWECDKPKVRQLSEIMTTLKAPHLNAANHSIPMVLPVEMTPQSVPINPYLLGVLIGDGSLHHSVTLTSTDDFIVNKISEMLPDGISISRTKNNRVPTFSFPQKKAKGYGTAKSKGSLVNGLMALGLNVDSYNKFIPDIYKFNNINTRLELLRGLMDTDGTVSRKGKSTEFASASLTLINDVKFLIQSFGGTASMRSKMGRYKKSDGSIVSTRLNYTLSIKLPPDINPFSLPRKRDLVVPKTKYKPTRYIKDVEYVGVKEAQCISIEHPSHLYVTDDFILTHNTLVMIGAAMKLKQMGVANKPTIIALKSTIPDIVAEARKIFPLARILAPTETDFSAKNRKALLSRIQNNDWDLVIMSHDQFKFIPQDPEYEYDVIQQEIWLIEKEMLQLQSETGSASKQQLKGLETRKKNLSVKLQEVQAKGSKDKELLNFKQIGIDHIFVDESQQFKNLPYATKITRVAGLGDPSGSSRAFNLLTAIRTLQAMHGGDKGTTFLSGTPISNSLVEMYLLLKYLRPTKMAELGYDTFDAWVKNAAKQSSEIEFSVTGSVAAKTRFRTFINIPEMAMLYSEIADVRNDNNLQLPKPSIRGGGPELVTVRQSPDQETMTNRLMEFASQPHKQRDGALIGKPNMTDQEQNAAMLLATSISTKLAVDMRLINPHAEFNPEGKLAAVADKAFSEYIASHGNRGTQLIFSDIGTPKTGNIIEDVKDYLQDQKGVIDDDIALIFGTAETPKKLTQQQLRDALQNDLEYSPEQVDAVFAEAKAASTTAFNVYDEIKRLLVEKGVPAEEIAFIHNYKTDKAKAGLYADVNTGKIRILLGSTQKLGTGVNVQKRIVAMHHVDASWNPAAMAQRNGRGIRQGNINEEVAIYNYGTERTLDAYKYQLIATKQKFIDQVKNAATADRTYREDDGEDMTAQEFVAQLSGDPTLLEKAKNDAVVDKLKRAKKGFEAEQYAVKGKISETGIKIATFEAAVQHRTADLETVKANSSTNEDGDLIPAVVIDGKIPKDSKERTSLVDAVVERMRKQPTGNETVVGKVSGLSLLARTVEDSTGIGVFAGSKDVKFFLVGEREYPTTRTSFSPAINRMAEDLNKVTATLKTLKEQLAKYRALEGQTWPKQDDFEKALARQKELDTILQEQVKAAQIKYPTQEDRETPIVQETTVTVKDGQSEIIQYQSVAPEGDYPVLPTEGFRSLERVWAEDKSFNFTGKTKIRNAADVANIMRVLEDKSVEHVFAVHVDSDNIPHIQYLSVGNANSAIVDISQILDGAKRFKSKKTYFIHNHPSGNVNPSQEDIKIARAISRAMLELGVEVECMIMNTYHQKYAVFDDTGVHIESKRSAEVNERKFKAYNGHTLKALSEPTTQITSSQSVFEFLHGVRFGVTPKAGMLILNQQLSVIGNYLFATGEPTSHEVLKEFSTYPTAVSVIFYGNKPMPTNIKEITAPISGVAKVLDYVHVDTGIGDKIEAYTSASDEGISLMAETQAKYETNTLRDSAPIEKTYLNRGQMRRLLARLRQAIPAEIFADKTTLREKLNQYGISESDFLFGSEQNPHLSEANRQAFEKARRMKAEGKTNTEIRTETGWFTGLDQTWKYGIDDSHARFIVPVKEMRRLSTGAKPDVSKAVDFNQVFSHPELEREYPDIVKNTKFIFYEDSNQDFGGGVLNYRKGDTRFIGININFSEARTTNDRRLGMDIGLLALTIHEIQHILQNRELERKGQQPINATGASLFARIKEGTLRIFQPDGTVFDYSGLSELQKQRLAEILYFTEHSEIEARAASENNDLEDVTKDIENYDFASLVPGLKNGFYWIASRETPFTANLKQVSDIEFMRKASGTVYGAAFPDGSIYLNPDHLNAETPIHEFGHLWVRALKHNDPEQYQHVYHRTRHDVPAMEAIRNNPAYAHLSSKEAVVDEVLARTIGDLGARKWLRETGITERQRGYRRSLYEFVSEAMSRLRRWLGYESVTDIADLAASRLLSGQQIWQQDQLPWGDGDVRFSLGIGNDIRFSLAQEGTDNGNPDPIAETLIRIKESGATTQDRMRQYAKVWIDVVRAQSPAFIQRGLELVASTEYMTEAGGDAETALANALRDRVRSAPKSLVDWAKQFWTRVGKFLRLNIDPDKLADLSFDEYLDIAAVQIRYTNELYTELAFPAQDQEAEPAAAKPESQAKPKTARQRNLTPAEIDSAFDDLIAEHEPAPQPQPRQDRRQVSAAKTAAIDNRNKSAASPKITPELAVYVDRLLSKYSGKKQQLLETVKLLLPTLHNAGISIILHETPDAFYNAVFEAGGRHREAALAHGFYKNKEVHIALFRPDLKPNTALHEAFHPLIREILLQQPRVFDQFIADILNDPDLRQRYWENFAVTHYSHLPLNEQHEEAVIEATADIVLARILRDLSTMTDNVLERVLAYIKKALGETWGQLYQFLNTREGFQAFAEDLANAISKGMVVNLNPDAESGLRTTILGAPQFSMAKPISLLSSLRNSRNEINYEQVEAVSRRVLEGRASIKRLNPEEERGRIKGGRRNVEASLVAGASQRAGQRHGKAVQRDYQLFQAEVAEQEQALEAWAKARSYWIDYDEFVAGHEFLDKGMEADVYRSFTGSHVIKLIGYKHARLMTPLEFLDNRISLWNHIFPETAYTLQGITRDSKGYFRFVVQQPFVQKGGHVTVAELKKDMKRRGLKVFDFVEPTIFINSFYNVNDLHLKNVIKSPDGTILFIDGVTILNEPDEGRGGIRAYPDFDVFDAESGAETSGFDQSQYFADLPPQPETPSFSLGGNDKSEEAKIRLRSFLVTNPDHDFEPVAAKLIAAGLISKDEADDILHGWRQTRARGLSRDAALEAVMDMEELLHLRRKDERDNGQVNNAILREIVEAEAANTDLGDLSKRYSPYRIKEMVEEVAASGLAHPGTVLESLQRLNQDETEPLGGPKLTVAVQIALTELNAAAEQYQEVFNRTGDLGAAEMLSYIADIKARIAWEAEIQGSRAGAALGIRSQLIALAGLTYESEIDALEKLAKSKAGTGADVSDHDKAEIKRLINELNALKKAAKEAETTNLEKKAAAAETAFYRRRKSSLEAKPTLTKEEAIELLRRRKTVSASFSLALSADEDPEYSYYDIINELVKIVHTEGVSGFKDVVKAVQAIDNSITEDDIYTAILSTTPLAKQKALSEYGTRQAHTRKHVKDIAKLNRMLTEDVTRLMREQKVPEDKRLNEFGNLLREIEANIHRLDPKGILYSQWLNALNSIRTNYGLAFLTPDPEQDTELLLSKIINAARMLSDQKTREWMEQENDRLNKEIADVNAGKISQTLSQEDIGHIQRPKQITVPVFDAEGNVVGTRIEDYDFGKMDRMIQDKRKELAKVKDKYRKKSRLSTFFRKLRGTLGSNLAMADLSYFAIQSFKMMVTTDPRKSLPIFFRSLAAMRDEFRKNPGYANKVHSEIMDSKWYETGVASGLSITSPDAHVFINEMMSADDWFDDLHDWTRKRNGVAAKAGAAVLGLRQKVKMASNAAFATHLNLLAIHAFSEYVEKVQRSTGHMPTKREMEAIAESINNSLGRSTNLEKQTRAAAMLFWAPKLYLSQIMNIGTIVTDPAKLALALVQGNKDLVRAYGHRTVKSMIFAATTTGLYILRKFLAELQCKDKINAADSIKDKGFGKITCGELTFNPTGNHVQWLVRGYQYLMAMTQHPVQGFRGRPMGIWDIAQEHMQYKTTPPFSFLVNLAQGTDFLGRRRDAGETHPLMPISRAKVIGDYAKPIFLGSVPDIVKAEGPTGLSKPFIIVEALLGSGVTYISAAEKAERAEADKQARKQVQAKSKQDWIKQYPQFSRWAEGEFVSPVKWEYMEPTNRTKRVDGVETPVFKRLDMLDDDNPKNDFVVIRRRKEGKNKGLKYLDWRILEPKD